VNKALADVLGWKVNAGDAKGFVGALTQSFTLSQVEGHTQAAWSPRSYAVQTDLAGGITGAQASIYTRAKDALDKCLPLLDGLRPLDPEAESQDVTALRALAKSQLTEIVREFGGVGGPSPLRVDTYFEILLGASATSPIDADSLTAGTLKSVRDVYGLNFDRNAFSNSIDDEQDITNFRIVVDYVISLLQTWINNKQFFTLGDPQKPAFFGTQLVLISRQLSVLLETVNEVRFALDSVFIGPAERQTLLLEFPGVNPPPPIFIEDMLTDFQEFFSDEAPRLLREGGRLAVKNNISPVICTFRRMAEGATNPTNIGDLPDGYRTARVRRTLADLLDQTTELSDLVRPVERSLPRPEREGRLLVLPHTLRVPLQNTSVVSIINIGDTPITNVTGSIVAGASQFSIDPPTSPATLNPFGELQLHVRAVSVPSPPPKGTAGVLRITADGQESVNVTLEVLQVSSVQTTI